MKRRTGFACLLFAGATGAFGAAPVEYRDPASRAPSAVSQNSGSATDQQVGRSVLTPGVPVVGSEVDRAASSRIAAGDSPASGNSNFAYEMQLLREEVQQLRGQVEQQNYRLDRLEREARERYLDIDRRLRDGNSTGAPVVATAPGGEITVATVPTSGTSEERVAYARAVQFTRDKEFQAAIDAFNQLLVDFPGGEFSANSFYWLGELYMALPIPEYERARQNFVQVISLYPDNAKVSDALYKLGVVYDKLGDKDKAREYYERTRKTHPGTTAGNLANTALSNLR